MAHRTILTERQRASLFNLPTDEAALLRHYTLADDDLEHIHERRRPENRIGFALQLCALRYPGRLLSQGEVIPESVLRFIGAQLGITGEALLSYAARRQTRQQHLEALREIYGYKMFSGRRARDLKAWLEGEAETARSNEDLAKRFIGECRRTQTILPGISTIERLCADALVAAERRIETRIVDRLSDAMREQLDALLTEHVDGRVSRFIWLRQFEVGKNSADINRLLDRLECLQGFEFPVDVLGGVPPHRITRLRRQGERYFTDGLRDISSDRRLAILAVCAVEWRAAIADAVVEPPSQRCCASPAGQRMTGLSVKHGGMQRSCAMPALPLQRHHCRRLCALLKTWVLHYSKQKGMMRRLTQLLLTPVGGTTWKAL